MNNFLKNFIIFKNNDDDKSTEKQAKTKSSSWNKMLQVQ